VSQFRIDDAAKPLKPQKTPTKDHKVLPPPLSLSLSLSIKKKEEKKKLTLHNIPPNLQFPTHKKLLGIGLPLNQLPEIVVTETQDDVRFFSGGRLAAFGDDAGLFQVDVPGLFGAGGVLELEAEDRVALLDC
jgi:hypothetical protein